MDEFTGRPVEGRSWSDGLQQAIEAKEGVEIQQEERDGAAYMGMGRYGSKLSQGTAGFSAWFHLAGFHFGRPCSTHTPMSGLGDFEQHPLPISCEFRGGV